MNKEQIKRSLKIREELNEGKRRFVMDREIEQTKTQDYSFKQFSFQLHVMAQEGLGTMSDAYIMFAICLMGVCDLRTITTFLSNLKQRNPELVIMDTSLADNLRSRIRQLRDKGLLYTIGFAVPNWSGEAYENANELRLFTPTRDTINFVNKKLNKRISHNEMIQAMPSNDLVGWASATYVGATMASSKYFDCYLDRVFRNMKLGSIYLPMELRFNRDDDRYYVAVMKGYMVRDERIQTEDDFKDYVAYTLNSIRQYIQYRTRKGTACVVISVMDNKDLVTMGRYIKNAQVLDECLPYIFFTGEGPVNMERHLKDAFLQLQYNDDAIEFVPAQPVFID